MSWGPSWDPALGRSAPLWCARITHPGARATVSVLGRVVRGSDAEKRFDGRAPGWGLCASTPTWVRPGRWAFVLSSAVGVLAERVGMSPLHPEIPEPTCCWDARRACACASSGLGKVADAPLTSGTCGPRPPTLSTLWGPARRTGRMTPAPAVWKRSRLSERRRQTVAECCPGKTGV